MPAIVGNGWWSRGFRARPWPFPHRTGWGLWRIRPACPARRRGPRSRGVGWGCEGSEASCSIKQAQSYCKPQNTHAEAAITINSGGRLPGWWQEQIAQSASASVPTPDTTSIAGRATNVPTEASGWRSRVRRSIALRVPQPGQNTSARRAGRCIARRNGCHGLEGENRVGLREIRRVSRTRDQSGWPRRSRLGTSRHLGNPAYAATASGTVQFSRVVQSVGEALELCAGLTPCGRHGKAAWCGQEDTGGTRAAVRAGGRQLAFRHRSQLCERPALLAHIFIRRHRPTASGRNTSCGGRRPAETNLSN